MTKNEKIFSGIEASSESVIVALKKYLSAISAPDKLLLFSDNTTANKFYTSYREFTEKLLHELDLMDSYAAQLSSLVCSADQSMETNELSLFSTLLDSYTSWRVQAYSFVSSTDKIFADRDTEFKGTDAVRTAREFLTKTEQLKGKFDDEKIHTRP